MTRGLRLRRIAHLLAKVLIGLVLGLIVLIAIALISLDVPAVRAFVAERANSALAGSFRGRLTLRQIGHIDLRGVAGVDVDVHDPAGNLVLSARNTQVAMAWPALAYAAVVQRADPLLVHVNRVSIEELRIRLIDDGTGSPTLAQAFEPQETEPKPQPSAETRVRVDEIEIATSIAHGSLKAPGPIDAALFDLRASLALDSKNTRFTLERVDLRARRVAQFETARARVSARVSLEDERVSGVLDIDPLSLAALKPASLHAEVSGALDDLAFEARVLQDKARVDIRGQLRDAAPDVRLNASLDASGVDLSAWLAGAPATALATRAELWLTFAEHGAEGSYRVTLEEGSRLQDEALPQIGLQGALALPSDQPLRTDGSIEIAERGAPTRIDYELRLEDAGPWLHLRSRTELARPARVKRLAQGLTLSGVVEASAEYDPARRHVTGSASLKLRDVVHPSLRVRRIDGTASVSGGASKPELRATLNAQGLAAGEHAFASVRVSAQGTAERLEVAARLMGERPELIELRASVFPGEQRLVQSVRASVANEAVRAEIGAAAVSVGGGAVEVEGLTLDGVGHAELSLRYARSIEQLELRTERLRPASILRLLGIRSEFHDGLLDIEASVDGRARGLRAHVRGTASEVALGRLRGGTARIDLALADDRLNGDLELALGAGANARLHARDLLLPRSLTEQAIARVTGSVTLAGDVDLRRLQLLFPIAGIERADGKVRFDVALERPSGAREPEVRAKLESSSLMLVGQRASVESTGRKPESEPEQADRAAPWTLRGIDIDVSAELAARAAKIAGRLHGKDGDLIALDAEWKDVSLSRDLGRAKQALLHAPFRARVHVPPRALQRLPPTIRPTSIRGTLAVDVDARGTLMRPELTTRASLVRFGPATEREDPRGLDVSLDAEYAPAGGSLSLQADGRKLAVLRLDSRWHGDLRALAGAKQRSPVKGELELNLDEFPVVVVPALKDRRIRGRVSGQARLDGFGENARLQLALLAERLRVDRMTLDRVEARVRTDRGRVEVDASIAGAGGKAGARLSAGIDWGARAIPIVDQNVQGAAFAERLRLAFLKPLVEGSVSELDGRVDAEIRAALERGSPQLSGRVTLRDGVLQLPAIGQRFHGISLSAHVTPERIRVEELSARGVSGELKAHAEAKLAGLQPVAATATVRVREQEKLPITIEGETIGDAWGTIIAEYESNRRARTQRLHINMRRFVIELPEAPPSGIQELEQASHVRVGFRRADRKFAVVPLQPIETEQESGGEPTTTTIIVDLGSVRVKKGQQAEVALGGQIRATLGERLDVRGQIETRRGTLDISGKEFEIERGSVSFTGGEPSDPTISAVARYDSPAGYTVYAEYTGTARAGKLRLSSDPPLSQDEILTLLLFGTPDGSFGGGSNSDSLSTAVSVAGGTAAKGLNRALSDVTDLDVSARIDTSTGAPRPELVVQLTPRVAARVTQALGEPTPGQSPDRTFLTVEFRFARAWSLSTMVGDRGASALDLVWRNRY